MERLIKIGDALSQLTNVTLLPNVSDTNANESISGRAHRKGWGIESFIDFLFFWEEAHCKKAYENDLQRARDLLKGVDE